MYKKKLLLLSLFVFLLPIFIITGCFDDNDLVRKTKFGYVEGIEHDNNTWAWESVPFAKPPVGDLRWRAPQDPEPWEGIKETKEECNECTQMNKDWSTNVNLGPIGSEDCLYLDIYRPASKMKKLPVYVFMHGGGFIIGSKKEHNNLYDGSVIASKDNVIVVVIQYRLGPLGWLTHPSMRNGKNNLDATGNYGSLDTFKALEWIKNNIKAFGGDPGNVLITGESAGACNVMNSLISPLAKGLFHKAMSESGGFATSTLQTGDQNTDKLIASLMQLDGSSEQPEDIESYLRGKSAYDLINAYNQSPVPINTLPFEDGIVFPEGGGLAAVESGNYNKVPIIVGTNKDEITLIMQMTVGAALKYAYLIPDSGITEPIPSGNYTWADFLNPDLIGADILPKAEDKALYKACAEFGSLNIRYIWTNLLARKLKEQQENVYAYLFAWDSIDGSGYNQIFGATHGTEIPFFFGRDHDDLVGYNPENDTPGRKALSDAMMKYLHNFAYTGNPNSHCLPEWDEWSNEEGKGKCIVLDATETEPDIHMMNEEVTQADVDAKFWGLYFTLPESTRNALWFVKW